MPIEAHQLLFAANAAAEGVDAFKRRETTGERVTGAAVQQLRKLVQYSKRKVKVIIG
jgi:hypothetical protein